MAEAKKPVKKTKAEEKAQLEQILKTETEVVEQEAAEVVAGAEQEVKTTAKAGKRSAKALAEEEAKEAKQERKKDSDADAAKPKKPVQAKNPTRPKAERAGKKYREVVKLIDKNKTYSLTEALELATKTSTTKFDATVELHVNLGVDPKQADQNVRDTVVLPAGTGKSQRIAAFVEGDDIKAAKAAGADLVGADEITAALDKQLIEFDVLVAPPALMARLGKYARLLGPRGLMPNPKSGTVTADIAKAIEEAKAGRVEYRVDQAGIIHLGIGKVSFGAAKLQQNADAVMASVRAAKPSSLKGNYLNSVYVTTSMGPSIRVEV